MLDVYLKDLRKRAADLKGSTPFSRIAAAVLANKDLSFERALEKELKAAGISVTQEAHKPSRVRVEFTDGKTILARASSGTYELALGHALLGALREKR